MPPGGRSLDQAHIAFGDEDMVPVPRGPGDDPAQRIGDEGFPGKVELLLAADAVRQGGEIAVLE